MSLYIVTTQHNGTPYYLKQFTPATVNDQPQYVWSKHLHNARQLLGSDKLDSIIIDDAQRRGFNVHKLDVIIPSSNVGPFGVSVKPILKRKSGLDDLPKPRSVYV